MYEMVGMLVGLVLINTIVSLLIMYLLNVFYWIIQKEYDKEPIIFFEYTGKQSKYLDDKEFTSIVEYKGKDYDDAERIRDEGMKKWMKKNTQWPMKNMKKESLNYS